MGAVYLAEHELLGRTAAIEVLDFGIAKLAGEDAGMPKTRDGLLMGTPAFMSPEQCRCSGDVDARSDIHALGCVMFAMLTGRPPFRSKAPDEPVAAHLRELPPRASSIVAGAHHAGPACARSRRRGPRAVADDRSRGAPAAGAPAVPQRSQRCEPTGSRRQPCLAILDPEARQARSDAPRSRRPVLRSPR